MTDNTQPKERSYAERIASFLDRMDPMFPNPQAAAELRRLDEVNRELIEALKEIVFETASGSTAQRIAQAAIAKATGEQA